MARGVPITEATFGIDYPIGTEQFPQHRRERRWRGQGSQAHIEIEFYGTRLGLQLV